MPEIPRHGVLDADAQPPAAPGLWGPSVPGVPQLGVPGDEAAGRGVFAPHGPGRVPRTVSGSAGRGSAGAARPGGTAPPAAPHCPPGFEVPSSMWWGERAVQLFRGVLACPNPPDQSSSDCFVPELVIFRAPAYILALSQSGGWPHLGRGPPVAVARAGDSGDSAAGGCAPGGPWSRGKRLAQPWTGVPLWMGSWDFVGALLPPAPSPSL